MNKNTSNFQHSTSHLLHIVIDGPAASGKGTAAKALAKRLGIPCFDTGALYRACGVFMQENDVDLSNAQSIALMLPNFNLDVNVTMDKTCVHVNGQCYCDKIRTFEAGMAASRVAVHQCVRDVIVAIKKRIAKTTSFIVEGRGVRTEVLPDAKFDFFLTAPLEVRARRRQLDLAAGGQKVSLDELMNQINVRDENDANRAIHPMVIGEETIVINTEALTPDQVVDKMYKIVVS